MMRSVYKTSISYNIISFNLDDAEILKAEVAAAAHINPI